MKFNVELIKSDKKNGVTVVEVTPVLSSDEANIYASLLMDFYVVTKNYTSKGIAHLHPGETWDKEKGYRIATAKACRAARKRMIADLKDTRRWYDKKLDELLGLNEKRVEELDDYLKNS